ncbi:hypothetical protein FIU97_20290 (plasmid) [Roseivivax sp. THAF40]|nr:hypothetical protein FIU97_20290 [Roseivivax sp. THAF40]
MCAFGLHAKDKTRALNGSVNSNGTGSADPMFTANMYTGKPQIFAQEVGEMLSGWNSNYLRFAIDP